MKLKILIAVMFATTLFAQQDTLVIGNDTLITRPQITNFLEPRPTNLSETGLVFATYGGRVGQTLVDISGNGNNGIITEATSKVDGSMVFDGVDDKIVLANDETYDVDGVGATFAFRLKRNSTGVNVAVLGNSIESSYSFIQFLSGGDLSLETNTNANTIGATINDDTQWHNYVITCNSGTGIIYEDGVALSTTGTLTDNITLNQIGLAGSSSRLFNGEIADIQTYNVVWTESQAVAYHNSFANEVVVLENFDYPESSTEYTRNWTEGTGTYTIGSDSEVGLFMECSSAGTIALQSSSAYGTFEFKLYKGGAGNVMNIAFLGTDNSNYGATANYWLRFHADESIQFLRSNATDLFLTAVSYFLINTWYTVKITRTTDGEFYVYLDDVLIVENTGNNPVTNTTYTTSSWFVLDLDSGDRISDIKILKGVAQ